MIKQHQAFSLWNKPIFVKAVIAPPFRFMVEMPNEACFYYLVQGSADVITPTQKVTSAPEEGLVLQCGNYINDYLAETNEGYCEAIAVHFYPEVLKMIFDRDFPDFLQEVDRVEPLPYQKVKSSALLKTYIDGLQFYFENPELVSDELLKLKLKELILLLAKTDNAATIQSLIGALFSKRETDFKSVIEANLYVDVNVDELAALTNQSLSTFKRSFLKHFNSTPAKYIRDRRLERAAKMLLGTKLRIVDVAYECGFKDQAHFSKLFMKIFGVSPSQYRLDEFNKSMD